MTQVTHTWNDYPLAIGTETALGTIQDVTPTAYLIDDEWVGFYRVHGPHNMVEPLVNFNCW